MLKSTTVKNERKFKSADMENTEIFMERQRSCGKYGHVSESCLGNSSVPENLNLQPALTAKANNSTTEAFGPWILVEKRQRRPTCQPPTTEVKNTEVPHRGSQFNPLSDELDDVVEVVNGIDCAPTVGTTPSVAQQHKGKSISILKKQRAIPIHKPLTVTLNDFPIITKSAAWASSSRSIHMNSNTTTLDKTRHSSIVISEKSDPNLPAKVHDANSACTNNLTLGKPPDPSGASLTNVSAEGLCRKQTNSETIMDSRIDEHACGHRKFRNSARQYLRDYKPDLVVFVEPCVSGSRADSIIASLGFSYSHRVEAKSPNATKRKALWFNLQHLASSICEPWILFGDFNATLCLSERMGSSPSMRLSRGFQDLVHDVGLRDTGFTGPNYTWQRGFTQARLDRFLCNSYWDESFPVSTVQHLLGMKSDHMPIFLQVGETVKRSSASPFRYLSSWLAHSDFNHMVADNWLPPNTLSENIISFTKAADTWNKIVYGYIGTKKRIVMARLCGVQKALCTKSSRFLSNLESELLMELESILDQEDLLWRQKSRNDWIVLGDRNTRYFYIQAICRKQQTRVTTLKLSTGEWCSDATTLHAEVVNFFQTFFTADDVPKGRLPVSGRFPSLPQESLSSLGDIPSDQEIYEALMAMAPLKSPGWDGLHAEFFQK
ncbi:hypothetical protein V6N13_073940 [Hibiscus sabdariffa]